VTENRSRHLSCAALRDHIDNGMPMLIPIDGDPLLFWSLEAEGRRPSLRVPVPHGTRTPRLDMHGVRAVGVLDGERQYLHVVAEQPTMLREFHIMCCEIADRVQSDSMAPVTAVVTTVAAWRRLLARKRPMSLADEIGLYGELLTLVALAAARGWAAAVTAWQHPDCVDHDFTVGPYDVEVKTAASQARLHTVHGLGQLQAHDDRPLWFVSHLIEESDSGRSVLSLVEGVRAALSDAAPGSLDDFATRLSLRLGRDHEVPREHRWSPSGPPLAVPVDAAFPALTESLLAGLPAAAAARITTVKYGIDIADLPAPHEAAPDRIGVAVDLPALLPPDVPSGLDDTRHTDDTKGTSR